MLLGDLINVYKIFSKISDVGFGTLMDHNSDWTLIKWVENSPESVVN